MIKYPPKYLCSTIRGTCPNDLGDCHTRYQHYQCAIRMLWPGLHQNVGLNIQLEKNNIIQFQVQIPVYRYFIIDI